MAHRIDALSSDANAVAELPQSLFGFWRCPAPPPLIRAGVSDDGMFVLPVDAVRSGRIFYRRHREQAFDEHFHQLHETSVLLHRNDEAFIFVPQMLLHELRGLPIAQFTFGGRRSAFRVRSLACQLFEDALRIKGSRSPLCRMRIGRRASAWIRERPFQCAVNNQIGIPPDGRRKMCVLIEAQREMAE